MARYELVKHDTSKSLRSPRLKITLLDTDGSVIAEGYLIIYREYCFQVVDKNNDGDLGSTPVMNLNNLSKLPDKYQASIFINMMAEKAIYEFVKEILIDTDIQASSINFYDMNNYNTLGKFTEECMFYLFGDFNRFKDIKMSNNYLYQDEYVRYSK